MNNSELFHHGILGQKWGVRRFQNPDGSLTRQGRLRYDEYKKRMADRRDAREEYRKDTINATKGLSYDKNTDTYKIAKGRNIGRQTTADETIDDKAKYVYVTKNDRDAYREYAAEGMLGTKWDEHLHEDVYKAKKDILVAGRSIVEKNLLEKYGNSKIKDVLEGKELQTYQKKIYEVIKDATLNQLYYEVGSDGSKAWLYGKDLKGLKKQEQHFAYLEDLGRRAMTNLAKTKIMNDPISRMDLQKDLIKKGYDAMVDVEDYWITELPIIILNPKDSIAKSKDDGKWSAIEQQIQCYF